ncbi:MAG: T9SS type A sorting domain-containing protein, partial [Bacteroidota bacterium]
SGGNLCGTDSIQIPVSINCLVGVANSLTSGAKLYPNPARDAIWVEIPALGDAEVKLEMLDVAGRVVQREDVRMENGRVQLSVRGFADGMYWLRVWNAEDARHWDMRFSVQR